MGQTATCERSNACGTCGWGRQCLTCVYHSAFSDDPPKSDTICQSTTEAVGLQIVVPILLLLLLFSISYFTYRWFRMRRIRDSQMQYNVEVARIEGLFAAKASDYSFSKDIFPYLLPSDIRTCIIYYPCSVKMSCIPAVVLLMLAGILIPLGLLTIQTGYNSDVPRNTAHLSTAGAILLCVGMFLCCLCCITHCLARKTRERIAQEHEQRPLQAASQEGSSIVLAESIVITVAEPIHEQPQTVIHQDPRFQYENYDQVPIAQQSSFDPTLKVDADLQSHVDAPSFRIPTPIVNNSPTEYRQLS